MAKIIYDNDGNKVGEVVESNREALTKWNLKHGPTWGETFVFFGQVRDAIKEWGDNHVDEKWYHTRLLWFSLLFWPLFLFGLIRRLTTKKKY